MMSDQSIATHTAATGTRVGPQEALAQHERVLRSDGDDERGAKTETGKEGVERHARQYT